VEVKLKELIIDGKEYNSRLIIGTGKYRDFQQTKEALVASGAEMITVAVRRVNLGQTKDERSLLEFIDPKQFTILPNTAGCYSAEDAVRVCNIAAEILDGEKLVKLEVLGDEKTLYPNVVETIKAAETLVKDGFKVMVYTTDDPLVAKELEKIGCIAIMPLASPIGSGLGVQNRYNILSIVENASTPIIVDAGVGTASDASIVMEMGCDGVLMNTAIACAKDPILMASAMKKAVESGHEAFKAGRIPKKKYASASSPIEGNFIDE
tara:strand:+ start:209 stop:1003 length:795 start_codon:yes stop_codon:yes gene_type:complete